MTASVDAPTYDADIYDDHSLLDPYEHYRALRDLGPAVWPEAHGAYAVSRYDDARAVLMDGETFRSANGIALNEPANQAILGCTLASDGEHSRARPQQPDPRLRHGPGDRGDGGLTCVSSSTSDASAAARAGSRRRRSSGSSAGSSRRSSQRRPSVARTSAPVAVLRAVP